MQTPAISQDHRGRGARAATEAPAGGGPGRRVLLMGAGVLAVFVAVDLLVVLRSDVGDAVAGNVAVLVALGAGALLAIVATYLAGRARRGHDTVGSDTLELVLGEVGGYTAIHGVNTRHGRIDHVLVGQGGVYVIAGNLTRGRVAIVDRSVRVGGHVVAPESYVRLGQQARHLESRIQQVCGRRLPVHAVYVFTRATIGQDCTHHGVRFTTLAALPSLLIHSRFFVDPRDVAIVKALVTGDPTALAQEARFGPDARTPLFPGTPPIPLKPANGRHVGA